jgi:hypothetical protein
LLEGVDDAGDAGDGEISAKDGKAGSCLREMVVEGADTVFRDSSVGCSM